VPETVPVSAVKFPLKGCTHRAEYGMVSRITESYLA
jgi:hypothetical protein